MALKKGSVLYSVAKFKCPQCQEGDFFVSRPYDLKNTGKVHEHCSECGLKYAKEPGYFFGAMYVSYGIGVAIFVAITIIYYLLFNRIDVWNMLIIMGIISVITAPINYCISKIIWANIFIRYKGQEAIQEHNAHLAKKVS